MFVGHMAVALAAKARTPRSSLGVFVAAAFALDLLWPGNSPLLGLGLGLWNSVAARLVLEGTMFAAALMVYLRSTTAGDRIGSVGFWLLIVFSTLMWASQPWSSPPPSPRVLAWFGLGTWLFPLWAGWADRQRVAGIT